LREFNNNQTTTKPASDCKDVFKADATLQRVRSSTLWKLQSMSSSNQCRRKSGMHTGKWTYSRSTARSWCAGPRLTRQVSGMQGPDTAEFGRIAMRDIWEWW